MNGRDRWVPALFIYEKDMAPTEMRRASDGSGKQLVRRDGMPVSYTHLTLPTILLV